MDSQLVRLRTDDRLVSEVTNDVSQFCRGKGDGLCHVFVPHATAGVALMETGSGSESDLADAVDRVLPHENVYQHRHGSSGHGRDHVLPVFISPSLSIPVLDGDLQLGTWQSIVIVDTNVDNSDRQVRMSFLPA